MMQEQGKTRYRAKRYLFPDKTIERVVRVKWWELELTDLHGLPFRDVNRCLDMIEEIKARKVQRQLR
jgi:hypothetical protein